MQFGACAESFYFGGEGVTLEKTLRHFLSFSVVLRGDFRRGREHIFLLARKKENAAAENDS